MRRTLVGVSIALTFAMTPAARSKEPMAVPEQSEDPHLVALVARELAALDAASAAALVGGAPDRALAGAGSFTLPYSDGRARVVVVGLAPGPPGHLTVPTQLEPLRFVVREGADETLTVAEGPARRDLVEAVGRVLADEAKALDAAVAAMAAAGAVLPPGRASWKEALRSVTYDARLPPDRFHGEPGWHFVFEPWDESHGGWHGVLLGAGLDVKSVDGRKPGVSAGQ
jgi:hypothetical protein